MKCHELAARIERLQPDATPADIARICLVLIQEDEQFDQFADDAQLDAACRGANMRLQLAADQHDAMTRELEELANSDPRKFSPDQIWVLLRAIKVQSQILQMYVGHPVIDV